MHAPAAAQGIPPTATATATVTATATPNSTPASPADTATSDEGDTQAQSAGLFSVVEGEPPPSTDVETLASRLVGIDFEQLAQVIESPAGPKDPPVGEPPTPQTLVLNLFDDAVFTGIVEHVEPTASGHAVWGSLDGVELGTMTLVVNGSIVVGTVRTLGAVYTIRTAGDGTYVIRQIDESSLPPLGEPLESSPSPRDTSTQSDDIQPDDGSVIDVMVVYTPLAKHREGGRAAIEALIDLFVTETNQAYANSGVIHRIRLVLRDEVEYIEDDNSGIDLGRLRNDSDGYMDHVHELRDLYAADLVHLVVGRGDVGGIAVSVGGDESLGFALTNSPSGLVFAHELGHNMGLHHDRYQLGVPRTGSHYGYVNQRMFEAGAPESTQWRTIMAYGIQCWQVAEIYCERLGYFSNPEKTLHGDPMGVPADHPSTGVDGPADGVGSLNERREITANFRRSSASPTPRLNLTLSPYWLSEDGGVSKVTATLHRPSTADTTVTVSASQSDAVTLSGSRTLTIPAGRTEINDSVTITGVDNDDQTGDVTVEISATAENTSSLGVIAPGPVELAIADDETTPVVTLALSPTEIPEFEGRSRVTAMLNNRSGVETTVALSARPSNAVQPIYSDTLIIPPGQRASDWIGASIYALDDDILTEAQKSVIVSGTATNTHGVTGPESVTLTIIDDEAPYFAHDNITYTFTSGVAGGRFLPEAAYGNGELTYSLSPSPGSEVTFTPGPPAQIEVPASLEAGREGSYTLTATDADGDTDTMTINFAVREAVCPNSAAVAGYSNPEVVSDCEAILASRDALSVERSLNWDEDLPIEEWEGVELAGNRVVGLRIANEDIAGTIPSELGNLDSLQNLSLWKNGLKGGIPKELGNLANLRNLDLRENQLTGEIPTELGDLTELNGLMLSVNRLTSEIPTELGSLAELRSINLASNQLTGEIPSELGSLAKLTRLALNDNQLTGEIPTELVNLSNLQELYLQDNLLTGCVPDGLRDVPYNDLVSLGLPFCIELACATVVAASGGANNPGLVSDCVALLAARDVLAGTATLNWSTDAPIVDWSGVVLDSAPERVTELDLSSLGLNGEIPTELGSVANLRSLDLRDNQLTGVIPNALGDLAILQELYLGGNRLSGCVPDELRDIPSNDFASLGLPFCSEHPCVSGGAVVDTSNPGLLSDCETLLAARDTLAGTATLNWAADTPISQWDGVGLEGMPQRVTGLSLWNKSLNGTIPAKLAELANLQVLDMGTIHFICGSQDGYCQPTDEREHNRLAGQIPSELGNLANLKSLDLFGNQLAGAMPTELGELDSLQWLDLRSNDLTGTVPAELGNLANLKSLYLSGNQLTGRIPAELGGLVNLEWLVLSNNELRGTIPVELASLNNLVQLSLVNNELTGAIPAELGSLVNLQSMYLGNNHLNGEIPLELGNLPHLRALFLSNNQLTGEIPTELGRLTSLSDLLLSYNDLEGSIPASLGSLRNLERLYLSNNRLTGCVPPRLRDVPDNDFARLRLSFCALSPPDAPTIGSVTPELDSLTISWAPPLNDGGSDITAYDLRHIETDGDETVDSNWTVVEDVWTPGRGALGYRLTGLTGGIQYDIQVRAVNAEGDSPWSETVTGTPSSSVCVSGGAVADATNTGLISDCEALLVVRDNLAGSGATRSLNWASDTPLSQWYGVVLSGTPERVTQLRLHGQNANPERGLSEAKLNGTIPPELGRLSELQVLYLHRNNLMGEVPGALNSLSKLRLLYLYDNGLTGISDELGPGMTELRRLFAQRNAMVGEIPAGLGSMTNLDWLTLYSNQLTGEIPAELGGLTGLKRLYVHENGLTGEIPRELAGVSSLTHLLLHRNALTGKVSSELGGLTNLEWLSLYDNKLDGSIPSALGDLSSLEVLYLHGNDLKGPVPSELGNLTDLTNLWLKDNMLSGEIPRELGDLSSLVRVRISGNDFTGCIPAGLTDEEETGRTSDADSLGLEVCEDS